VGTPAPTEDHFAADLRGFGWLGVLAILAIVLTGNVFVGKMVVIPVGALLVLLWAWRSRTPWREIGYARPRTWIGSLALGVALGIAFKSVMKAVVMPLLGADPINHAYHFLAGNHYSNQGIAGVQQATLVGLLYGTIFAITGRIWLLMAAHAAFNLTALGMIYWNLESDVAHLIFK
jgi:hypothetical protein